MLRREGAKILSRLEVQKMYKLYTLYISTRPENLWEIWGETPFWLHFFVGYVAFSATYPVSSLVAMA